MFKLLSKDLVKSSKIRDTFPEEKDYEIGFSDHYNKYLKDKVERFEENRILTLKEARKRLIVWLFYIFFTSFIVYFRYSRLHYFNFSFYWCSCTFFLDFFPHMVLRRKYKKRDFSKCAKLLW